jgi:hypothetical protein
MRQTGEQRRPRSARLIRPRHQKVRQKLRFAPPLDPRAGGAADRPKERLILRGGKQCSGKECVDAIDDATDKQTHFIVADPGDFAPRDFTTSSVDDPYIGPVAGICNRWNSSVQLFEEPAPDAGGDEKFCKFALRLLEVCHRIFRVLGGP